MKKNDGDREWDLIIMVRWSRRGFSGDCRGKGGRLSIASLLLPIEGKRIDTFLSIFVVFPLEISICSNFGGEEGERVEWAIPLCPENDSCLMSTCN